MEYKCSKERFLDDVKDHTLEILKDDGLYRHLKFSNNGSSVYRFDLVTWPGYLCISGDMGCCVFSRIDDMFDFFGRSEDLNINPEYWEEKIESVASFKGVREFNPDLFRNNVIDVVNGYYKNDEDVSKKAECLEELEDKVFSYLDDEPLECIYQRMCEFEFGEFYLDTESYSNSEEYTFHYIWLCYAIVWGITKYSKTKYHGEE